MSLYKEYGHPATISNVVKPDMKKITTEIVLHCMFLLLFWEECGITQNRIHRNS